MHTPKKQTGERRETTNGFVLVLSYLGSRGPDFAASPVDPFVHMGLREHLGGSRVGDGIPGRLREDARRHRMAEQPAELSLLQARAIGQLSVRDDVLVFGEVLRDLEAIDGVEANELNAVMLRRGRE